MGFWTKFVDTWTDWDMNWGKVGEGFKTMGKSAMSGAMDTWAGTWNLLSMPFQGDDMSTRAALAKYVSAGKNYSAAMGGFGQGLGNIPVVKQVFDTADWAQTETVKRPLATSLLMAGDAFHDEEDLGAFLDRGKWKKAYNTTTYVTPGQAYFYYGASGLQAVLPEKSEMERREILRDNPVLGKIWADPQTLDPRDKELRRQYYDNPFMKGVSGSLDAGITIFADPTVFVGKLAWAGKAKYWSQEMNAAAVQAGKHTDFQETRAYGKMKNFIQNAKTPDEVTRLLFNQKYNGDVAGNLLWSTAQDQAKYEMRGGQQDLFDTTFRALYGDEEAWLALANDAPRIADVVGTKYANYSIGQLGKQYGLGDVALDAQWDAMKETRIEAFVDAMANGHGIFGQLGEGVKAGGLLTGQAAPRIRTTAKWRAGVHQWASPAPGTALSKWVKRPASRILPSSKTYRMLDLQDINSAPILRANLEHSRLPKEEIGKWVTAYGRATSRESRFAIYNAAENAGFKATALAHGMTEKQVNDLMPQLNKWRNGARRMMTSSRRFMSEDVRQLAQKRMAEGRTAEAEHLETVATQIDAAVERGDMPAAYHALPDEDGGLAMYAADTNIATTAPVLSSQHAETVPMVDWNVLDNALWWQTKGGFGKKAYSAVDGTRSALEAAMSVFKISAIMRPGYVWRALTDEDGRVMSVLGAATTFMSSLGGIKNSALNWTSRGKLGVEAVGDVVTRVRAKLGDGVIEGDSDIEDAATGMPTGPLGKLHTNAKFDPDDPPNAGKGDPVYMSYERAFADGVIGLDDFLERVDSHGQAGTLTGQLSEIWAGKNLASVTSEKLYRRHIIDSALRSVDRGVYTSPAWQNALLDTVQKARNTKRVGEPGKALVVDPFTGVSPKITADKIPDNFSFSKSRILTPTDGVFDNDHVYDFIADNIDDLLRPGSALAAFQRADGVISLSVARADKESAANLAIKPTGGKRIKLPGIKKEGNLYRDSGSATFRVNTPAGMVDIRGAFEGQAGDLFRAQTSSRGVDEAWADTLTNIEHARLMAKSGRWVDVSPGDWAHYRESWQRAVNLQLANDAVARQFLAGKTVDDVVAWMHNTEAGRAYSAKMGPWKSRYAEQIQIVEAMVDTYAPGPELVPDAAEASIALRKKILAGNAKIEDFEKVVHRDDMPRVHGPSLEYALGSGPWIDLLKKQVDRAFKVLSDLPSDKLARHPFAAERYKMHVDELARARGGELAKRQETFSADDLHAIESQARSRSLVDVRKYLYENAASHDLAKFFRLVVPFGSAIMDSTLKWGVVIRENPHVALNLWKLWTAPDKAGLVQDEDGNQLRIEDGKEVWYQVNPDTGEMTKIDDPGKKRSIVFRLPSWMGPEYAKGVRPTVRIDKNVFRTFLDMPTAGPLVTVPANEFALSHPEFHENSFVRTFILPYGPSADWTRVAVPGNVRNWQEFLAGGDSEDATTQAATIYNTELVNYALGERTKPPSFKEARSKAAGMRGLRFLWRLGGVSGDFTSPYRPYVDYYHQLQVSDPQNADERFYKEMGPEYFALTSAVTRNVMGLKATTGAWNQYKKFDELMDKFPSLAPLIAGAEGAGEFNKSIYENQKQTKVRFGAGGTMRRAMSPDESWEDMQRRKGWIEYGRFADALHADMARLGVTSLEQKSARYLKEAKQRWIKQRMFVENPYGGTVRNPWFADFSEFDTSKMTGRLHEMRQIVQDKRLQGRDDMRGLIDYLNVRNQFKQYMGRVGYKTLDSKKAQNLRLQWQYVVFGMKQRNLSFSQLYDRWLSNDDMLEAE